MVKCTKFIIGALLGLSTLWQSSDLYAQSSAASNSLLCRRDATGLVVTRAKCRTGETRINPASARFQGCYTRLGTAGSLAGKTSQVTIEQACNLNDVLVNHSISHNDTNNGIVSINSVNFTFPVGATHTLPQGVSFRLNVVSTSGIQPPIPNGANVTAEVTLLCCPFT